MTVGEWEYVPRTASALIGARPAPDSTPTEGHHAGQAKEPIMLLSHHKLRSVIRSGHDFSFRFGASWTLGKVAALGQT